MKNEFEKMADLKQKRIANFQDAKERSMAIMSSGRDAVLMVTALSKMYDGIHQSSTKGAFTKEDYDKHYEEQIRKWRKFFFYEIYGTDPDEEVKQQLKETAKPSEILGF